MMPPVATAMLYHLVACPHRGIMDLFGDSVEDEDDYRATRAFLDTHAASPVVFGDTP